MTLKDQLPVMSTYSASASPGYSMAATSVASTGRSYANGSAASPGPATANTGEMFGSPSAQANGGTNGHADGGYVQTTSPGPAVNGHGAFHAMNMNRVRS